MVSLIRKNPVYGRTHRKAFSLTRCLSWSPYTDVLHDFVITIKQSRIPGSGLGMSKRSVCLTSCIVACLNLSSIC